MLTRVNAKLAIYVSKSKFENVKQIYPDATTVNLAGETVYKVPFK